ncbi:hypothetical protein [Streptomyces hesseae]|uniref:Uncharacterized protein n=1 Tax=Streptomyces hesseae TaxID=3075519 RepID=A0ABU2SP39_9ACTN|nr:hypothetical protein [Streptomyces sp. DSM 40473]MDT0450528.1 hypothetical protein [Streptomyces sp. DSM 40473]
MSGSVISLVIAFLGILGTLASGLMTQRLVEKAKAKELEHAERQRVDERRYEAERATADALRACYVTLNTASLDYHSELNNFWYASRAGRVTDELRSRLDDARREHRARHSEAQMRVPDDVLAAAHEVNLGLSRVYGVLKRLDGGLPPRREGESLEQSRAQINEAWDQLNEMRRVMRRSLGVAR